MLHASLKYDFLNNYYKESKVLIVIEVYKVMSYMFVYTCYY